MNDFVKTLLTRRSVRAFKPDPVSVEDLETLMEAAAYAPSGMNRQTWEFTAVANPEKIQELAALIREELGREQYDMYRPAALIIPSNRKDSPFGREDNACALENIFLAAHSMGIGSVWINQLQGISDRPAIRKFLTELGIPEDHVVYGMAALGYAAKEPAADVKKTAVRRIVE